jgi:two-component system alkaline phosphatase synthesis response regulator PhoP
MPKKILIADDHVHIRILLAQTLEDFEEAGAEFLTTDNGLDAWDIAQSEQPDLIILDVTMPGLTGYEVCQRIKNDPVLSRTHVIMLTARGQDEDRERSIKAGADDYITKPFDPDHLIRYVADVLSIDTQNLEKGSA